MHGDGDSCGGCRGVSGVAAVRVVALYAPLPGYASSLRDAAIALRDTEPSVPLRPGMPSPCQLITVANCAPACSLKGI
jgi:hypothetical protein